jgi:hypothetical protein
VISARLTRRLERLEERILPPGGVMHVIRVLYAAGPDSPAVGGYTVVPGYGAQTVGADGQGSGSRDEWGICLKNENGR